MRGNERSLAALSLIKLRRCPIAQSDVGSCRSSPRALHPGPRAGTCKRARDTSLEWSAECCMGTARMARILELVLNGRRRVDAVPDNVLLLDYLREVVGLTGTKTGCDGGECGACTVLVDDKPRLSCLTLAATVNGERVDTVESLGQDGRLSAVQRGFHEKLGSQCG